MSFTPLPDYQELQRRLDARREKTVRDLERQAGWMLDGLTDRRAFATAELRRSGYSSSESLALAYLGTASTVAELDRAAAFAHSVPDQRDPLLEIIGEKFLRNVRASAEASPLTAADLADVQQAIDRNFDGGLRDAMRFVYGVASFDVILREADGRHFDLAEEMIQTGGMPTQLHPLARIAMNAPRFRNIVETVGAPNWREQTEASIALAEGRRVRYQMRHALHTIPRLPEDPFAHEDDAAFLRIEGPQPADGAVGVEVPETATAEELARWKDDGLLVPPAFREEVSAHLGAHGFEDFFHLMDQIRAGDTFNARKLAGDMKMSDPPGLVIGISMRLPAERDPGEGRSHPDRDI